MPSARVGRCSRSVASSSSWRSRVSSEGSSPPYFEVKAIAHARMAELDHRMAGLASMKASLEQMASRSPGDATARCPTPGKLSGDAAPAALPIQSWQRPKPVRMRARGVTARREEPSYEGLLARSQALQGGLTAHHARAPKGRR